MTAHASDADASGDDGSPPEFVPLEDEDAAARAWEDPSPDGALTILLEAAESGADAATVSSLCARLGAASVDARGPDGDTALHLAALYGHADAVRALLAAGASPRSLDGDGGTPLHDAAAGGFEEVCAALLDASAASESSASSPDAARARALAANARDGDGETPLHTAARGGHAGVVAMLLGAGAVASAKSDAGLLPAHFAEEKSAVDEMLERAGGPTPDLGS
jgi:ankyrin repeat protein